VPAALRDPSVAVRRTPRSIIGSGSSGKHALVNTGKAYIVLVGRNHGSVVLSVANPGLERCGSVVADGIASYGQPAGLGAPGAALSMASTFRSRPIFGPL
jgi:hypothetical protein